MQAAGESNHIVGKPDDTLQVIRRRFVNSQVVGIPLSDRYFFHFDLIFLLLYLCITLVNYPWHLNKSEIDLFYSKEVFSLYFLGPLLPEACDVANIPIKQRKNLTITLCGKY